MRRILIATVKLQCIAQELAVVRTTIAVSDNKRTSTRWADDRNGVVIANDALQIKLERAAIPQAHIVLLTLFPIVIDLGMEEGHPLLAL